LIRSLFSKIMWVGRDNTVAAPAKKKRWESVMKRALVAATAIMAAVVALPATALALPSETPDETLMVNGPVRAIEQVGTQVWVGGNFTQVQQRDGTVVDNVSNVAVFDSVTDSYVPIAPKLGEGSTDSKVTDIKVYGDDVLIAGKFTQLDPSTLEPTTKRNLVLIDGTTGDEIRWYKGSPGLESVLAAPQVPAPGGEGTVYGGGVSLSAFDFKTGKKLWTRARTTVDPSLRTHKLAPGYRDLELDGSTIWAACACDAVAAPDGTLNPAKALVKLSTEGVHDASWVADAGVGAFGISLVEAPRALYLGVGGSDFLAKFYKAEGGRRDWVRDTSGSVQVVEVMEGQLVIGGHFWEVADEKGDRCGFRSPSDPSKLDPNDDCQTRKGLAIYSPLGVLEPNWDPVLAGSWNLAWALHPEVTPQGTRLYVGGEFTKVSGDTQTNYARFS
jgi:hypothetical protein